MCGILRHMSLVGSVTLSLLALARLAKEYGKERKTMAAKLVNLTVNASSDAVAKSVVRDAMRRQGMVGTITGATRATVDRTDDAVAVVTNEPIRRTWIVHVMR